MSATSTLGRAMWRGKFAWSHKCPPTVKASTYPCPAVIEASEPTMGIIRQFVAIRAHFFQKTAGVEGAVAFP